MLSLFPFLLVPRLLSRCPVTTIGNGVNHLSLRKVGQIQWVDTDFDETFSEVVKYETLSFTTLRQVRSFVQQIGHGFKMFSFKGKNHIGMPNIRKKLPVGINWIATEVESRMISVTNGGLSVSVHSVPWDIMKFASNERRNTIKYSYYLVKLHPPEADLKLWWDCSMYIVQNSFQLYERLYTNQTDTSFLCYKFISHFSCIIHTVGLYCIALHCIALLYLVNVIESLVCAYY